MDPSELGIALSDPRLNRTLAEKGKTRTLERRLDPPVHRADLQRPAQGVGEHEVPIGVDALGATPLRRLLRRPLLQGPPDQAVPSPRGAPSGSWSVPAPARGRTPASGCGGRSRTRGRTRHPTTTSPGVRRVAARRARRAPAADTPDTAHAPVGRREYHYMTASRRPVNSCRDILKPDVPTSYDQRLPGRPRIRNRNGAEPTNHAAKPCPLRRGGTAPTRDADVGCALGAIHRRQCLSAGHRLRHRQR